MAIPALKTVASVPGGVVSAMAVPLATETIPPIEDLILHIKTTGTATTITWTDPGTTPSGTPAGTLSQTMAATEERFIRVPETLANTSGVITVAFSGALTGVTAEWLRS